MKNFKAHLFIAFFLGIFSNTSLLGQNNATPIAQYVYCEITGEKMVFGKKLVVAVDNGESKETNIKDDKGKIKVFNTMIDALNYMGDNGWEFVQAYASSEGNQGIYHYLLRKKK